MSTYHLAKAQAAVARAALGRLAAHELDGPARARVVLVGRHVAQALVVGDAQKHLGLEGLAAFLVRVAALLRRVDTRQREHVQQGSCQPIHV